MMTEKKTKEYPEENIFSHCFPAMLERPDGTNHALETP